MSYAEPVSSGKRLTGLAVVVLVHAAVVYALVTGLARTIVEVVRPPLETKIIEETKVRPPDKPPPPPPPRLAAPPPPYIPPPEVQVQLPPTAQPAISAITTAKPTTPVAPPGQRAPVQVQQPSKPHVPRTPAVVDAKACDKPEYPPASLRAQETGVVLLSFLIDLDGAVLESKVERSTGFRRLDEAARKALGLCKFKPATVDGKPEKSWARIEYEWKIE